jgi:hypothetical protein
MDKFIPMASEMPVPAGSVPPSINDKKKTKASDMVLGSMAGRVGRRRRRTN